MVDVEHLTFGQDQRGYGANTLIFGLVKAVAGLSKVDNLNRYLARIQDLKEILLGGDAYRATGVIEDCFFHGSMNFRSE